MYTYDMCMCVLPLPRQASVSSARRLAGRPFPGISIYLSIYLSLCLSIPLNLPIPHSIDLSLYIYIHL